MNGDLQVRGPPRASEHLKKRLGSLGRQRHPNQSPTQATEHDARQQGAKCSQNVQKCLHGPPGVVGAWSLQRCLWWRRAGSNVDVTWDREQANCGGRRPSWRILQQYEAMD